MLEPYLYKTQMHMDKNWKIFMEECWLFLYQLCFKTVTVNKNLMGKMRAYKLLYLT